MLSWVGKYCVPTIDKYYMIHRGGSKILSSYIPNPEYDVNVLLQRESTDRMETQPLMEKANVVTRDFSRALSLCTPLPQFSPQICRYEIAASWALVTTLTALAGSESMRNIPPTSRASCWYCSKSLKPKG